MKYVLIGVVERDIVTPHIFDTYEEAFKAMIDEVAYALDVKTKDVMEVFNNGSEDDWCGVHKDYAYCERRGNNFDWRIFTFDGENFSWLRD